MSNYWPSGLNLSDTQSPREILEVAQEDWYTNSEGIMTLVLQDAESELGNPMIIVHAKHVPSNRTARLLSIVSRPDNPYPVTIQPEVENLPNFLKKSYSYTTPGLQDIAKGVNSMMATKHNSVTNNWVSETPSEFREKLAEVFNLGSIKSKLVNLASGISNSSPDTNEETQEALVRT